MKQETFNSLFKTDWSVYGHTNKDVLRAINFIEKLQLNGIPLSAIYTTDWASSLIKVLIKKPYGMKTKTELSKKYERFSDFDIKNCIKWWESD